MANTAVGALGIGNGIKTELIEYAGKTGELTKGTGNYLKFAKGVGTVATVANIGYSTIQFANNPTTGNATRLAVKGLAIGTAFIPGVGWAISLGISAADMIWGDQFYEWIDNH